jgi:SAM-dependent methyltransferase
MPRDPPISMNVPLLFIDRYVRCPLCGIERINSAHTLDLDAGRLSWDRCMDCSLVFQNPRLAATAIAALYRSHGYFGPEGFSYFRGCADYVQHDRIRVAQSRRRMRRIIEISGMRRGTLLDVGSASGFFGVAAREAGFDVTCIEPDVDLAAYGSETYGLTFLANTLENCSLECERYDVITLWGTNSVLLHPLRSFEQLVQALKPGGVLAMNTQDFDHWIRRIFPRLMIGWNVMFNLSNRSLDVLTRKLGLSLIHRGLEWQIVAVDHIFRVLRVRAPAALRFGVIAVPAVSFPLIIARK